MKDLLVKLAFFSGLIGLVAGTIFMLISLQAGAETTMADLAAWLPLGWAFAAGMVASVNPCGFLMLPTYISYHLGTQETDYYERPALKRAWQALGLGLAATAGFLVILAIAGVIIAAGGQWLIHIFPYAGAVIGVAMVLPGIFLLLTHKTLGILAASRVAVNPQRNLRNVFLFGIAYATGSLSCTLPIFLVVVGSSLASQGLVNSFVQFISYGLGMGAILMTVTVGAALMRGTVARSLRTAVPYVHSISALFLSGSGAYLVYYWLFIAGL